jgi:hypothetical protein
MLSKLISEFKSRKIFYLMPLVLLSLFLVDIKYIILGIVIYFPMFRHFTLVYHEFQSHRYIIPKNSIIEAMGYFILAVWEMQPPDRKINFHQIHHDFFSDDEHDPTTAKLSKADNFWIYCLDISPHVPIPGFFNNPDAIQTSAYTWFNKYWERVLITVVISWLILLPFWTFLAFYCMPIFIWSIVYRSTDWNFHKKNYPDYPLTCLYLGTSAYHGRHHLDDSYSRETYYGKGFWRYLNIDYYITGLFFKAS